MKSTHLPPWHPYQSFPAQPTPLTVASAQGHDIVLADGRRLLDGIASWWTSIFGYQHPYLVSAITQQASKLSHIMFAGLTSAPADKLAERLGEQLPATPVVFFSDSGSVAVEIALKMARQYWQAQGKGEKQRFIALKNGYHGDTWGAMSVTDPNSLHQSFRNASQNTYFAPPPQYGFDAKPDTDCTDLPTDLQQLSAFLNEHRQQVAALILEPIWQGAGAMNFYRPDYLRHVSALCQAHQVLLIVDEIATGFGKTGQYFAHQHAQIAPDIVCLGKALTGGMMTLAATCASLEIAQTISQYPPYRFMHGPTYMGNPLACACANASLDLLVEIDWQARVTTWQTHLETTLKPLAQLAGVEDVRILGHIAVVEFSTSQLAAQVQPLALEQGIWIRPFHRWAYLTPAYTMSDAEKHHLTQVFCHAIIQACQQQGKKQGYPSAYL